MLWIDGMKKLSKSTLRWYIGTKSLMPVSDIRRRFGIDGEEVSALHNVDGKTVYVGLPEQAAGALDDLRQQGKIGYELSVDLNARVLIGAYVVFRKRRDGVETDSDAGEEQEDSEDAA